MVGGVTRGRGTGTARGREPGHRALVSGQSWHSGHDRTEDGAGRGTSGQAGRGPACRTRVNVGGTHRRKGKKGDADQGEGGRNQTALPGLGRLVPVADGGQCDLQREGLRRGAPRAEGNQGCALSPPVGLCTKPGWAGAGTTENKIPVGKSCGGAGNSCANLEACV